jgi:hypothetical protein
VKDQAAEDSLRSKLRALAAATDALEVLKQPTEQLHDPYKSEPRAEQKEAGRSEIGHHFNIVIQTQCQEPNQSKKSEVCVLADHCLDPLGRILSVIPA